MLIDSREAFRDCPIVLLLNWIANDRFKKLLWSINHLTVLPQIISVLNLQTVATYQPIHEEAQRANFPFGVLVVNSERRASAMLGRGSGIVFPRQFFICIQVGQTSHIRDRTSSTIRLEDTYFLHDSYTFFQCSDHRQ